MGFRSPPPNPPMKLSACGGRSVEKRFILGAAAAGRSLLRSADKIEENAYVVGA
jgi:hypothetical protein